MRCEKRIMASFQNLRLSMKHRALNARISSRPTKTFNRIGIAPYYTTTSLFMPLSQETKKMINQDDTSKILLPVEKVNAADEQKSLNKALEIDQDKRLLAPHGSYSCSCGGQKSQGLMKSEGKGLSHDELIEESEDGVQKSDFQDDSGFPETSEISKTVKKAMLNPIRVSKTSLSEKTPSALKKSFIAKESDILFN